MIKLLKFDGNWIITEIEELPEVELGDPNCVLKYAYQIDGSCLGSWPPYSDDREVLVRSSDILLIAEPKTFHLGEYYKLVDEEKKE